jgi:hypothetical protein
MNLFLRVYSRSIAVVLMLTAGACTGAREGGEEGDERRAVRPPQAVEVDVELDLAPAAGAVRTIQLYPGTRAEDQLPVFSMQDNEPLTLEFDLMESSSRPLSIYFYHTDRAWRRDLMPIEYMASFQRDDLLDFSPSRATNVRYVHYTYRFPNANIRFTLSGNYIVRVTEQGREDEILFERPFFVAEQTVIPSTAFQNTIVAGQGMPATIPRVRFTPPEENTGNPFDYSVCFIRNGQLEQARCSDNPLMGGLPALQFDLEPRTAFPAEPAEYFLDLSALRPGGQIEAADVAEATPLVTLKPDYAAFPGTPFAPLLNGQAVVSGAVRDVADPDVSAEYAEVGFSFVPPDEQALSGTLYIAGSFSAWGNDPDYRMHWVAERGRYEGSVLLKQGQYEYRYQSPDVELRQLFRQAPPRAENVYYTFVYFSDIRVNTDRLLGVEAITAR